MKISECSVVLKKVDGTELDIVNAARVSFHKESDWIDVEDQPGRIELADKDKKLINYLAKHGHWTPFAHVGATFVVKAPLFVARQLGKHQVGLVWNEVSRRYVDEEPEYFLPSSWRSRPESSMKQGSGAATVDTIMCQINGGKDEPRHPNLLVEKMVYDMGLLYKHLVDSGVAPEQARMVLPQNMMTEWWWTGSLAAWARVFKLRLDPHTQKETQDVVQMMYNQLVERFPTALNALLATENIVQPEIIKTTQAGGLA